MNIVHRNALLRAEKHISSFPTVNPMDPYRQIVWEITFHLVMRNGCHIVDPSADLSVSISRLCVCIPNSMPLFVYILHWNNSLHFWPHEKSVINGIFLTIAILTKRNCL